MKDEEGSVIITHKILHDKINYINYEKYDNELKKVVKEILNRTCN